MFDYIVRLLVWSVEGLAKVSQHPVYIALAQELRVSPEPRMYGSSIDKIINSRGNRTSGSGEIRK